ncbi:hypothetical protein DCCM_0387 [Desulfocucumis palustris]|uniref:Uncharacterized protein n=1 Tax=Desulfocucumis palustris TaxID=1898651 RepID=A0A2L2XD88_9FIRM|nr:hypothetical protein [Desulfocucumis palustris]GBF32196.1 hypothetical protein DCCM_0387 [Desulfocucumis palustris]
MAGIVNDYLAFPILDLIQREVRLAAGGSMTGGFNQGSAVADSGDAPFAGIPSVMITREHPGDSGKTIVNEAMLTYLSGYKAQLTFEYGANPLNSGYAWTLKTLITTAYDPQGQPVVTYKVDLNYDSGAVLQSTNVERTYGAADYHF